MLTDGQIGSLFQKLCARSRDAFTWWLGRDSLKEEAQSEPQWHKDLEDWREDLEPTFAHQLYAFVCVCVHVCVSENVHLFI